MERRDVSVERTASSGDGCAATSLGARGPCMLHSPAHPTRRSCTRAARTGTRCVYRFCVTTTHGLGTIDRSLEHAGKLNGGAWDGRGQGTQKFTRRGAYIPRERKQQAPQRQRLSLVFPVQVRRVSLSTPVLYWTHLFRACPPLARAWLPVGLLVVWPSFRLAG
jgi:hypothetical protein